VSTPTETTDALRAELAEMVESGEVQLDGPIPE
jgi:hypothetical protein